MKFFLPLLAVIIWAINTVVNKLSADFIEPGAMSFYRWFFAVAVLTPFCLRPVWKQRHQIKRYLPKLFVLASLGMVVNQSLGYFAAHTTTATNMALIMSMVPLISLFLSVPILSQPLTGRAVLGAVLSFGGLVFMLSRGDIGALLSQGITTGDGYILIAASSYALYCVLIKLWPMAISNWVSIYMQASLAVIMLFPVLLSAKSMEMVPASWPLIGFAALAASVIAPACWLQSIANIGASRSAMFMNLLPVMTALIAVGWLGEHLSVFHYVGGTLVILGVTLTQVPPKFRLLPRIFSPVRQT